MRCASFSGFAFAVLALTAITVVFAQTGPSISDDFSAQVEIIERHGHSPNRHFAGQIDESFTNKKAKIEAMIPNGEVEFLRLYNTRVEYENENNKTCHHRTFNMSMFPAFDWAKDAHKSAAPCHSNGRTGDVGVLYIHDGHYKNLKIEGYICVDSKNEKTPFWTDLNVHNPGTDEFNRLIYFHSFTPSNPNPAVFAVPKVCQ